MMQVENTDCVDYTADIRAKTQNGNPANRNSTGQSRLVHINLVKTNKVIRRNAF